MVKKSMNRRDFLKLAGLLSASYVVPKTFLQPGQKGPGGENVLIIVFDTFSASNISLYGYPRKTTPNIERLAERAIVYHNHYSGGNFTTPGTATLLTGVLPWTHWALSINDTVRPAYSTRSIFHAFGDYHRTAYSHNILVNTLLKDFFKEFDGLIPREKLYLQGDYLVNLLFKADEDIATVSWRRAFKRQLEGTSYSLYLAQLYEALNNKTPEALSKRFPRGLPAMVDDNYFLLEDGIDWVQNQVVSSPKPFLGYYHFNPPHDPYNTRAEFVGKFFKDGYLPPEKPVHLFGRDRQLEFMLKVRQEYDEFILYIDAEFARLYAFLEQKGILENTWLVLTSDHGELFERGVFGHLTNLLHQPLVHIPLLIFPPGQRTRQDVYDVTSAVDVLPTLLHVTGGDIPEWTEGLVLPPFSDSIPERDAFSVYVEALDDAGRINHATATVVRGNYK